MKQTRAPRAPKAATNPDKPPRRARRSSAQLEEQTAASAAPRATKAATDSTTSTSDEELERALGALDDPQARKLGGASEGEAAASSTDAPPDELAPLLSPEELVSITEAVSGCGLLLYAVCFGRELPSEQQTKFADSTRSLLGISAPGTLEAMGEWIQDNRETVRMLAPLGFVAGVVTHLVQRGRELRSVRSERVESPFDKPRERFVQPPVSSVPMAERPEVWRKPGQPPAPQPSGFMPPPGIQFGNAQAKFQPPPGVQFGQRKMPRIPVHDGSGPILPPQPHREGR